MYLIGFIIKCNNPPPKKKKSPTGSTSKTFANQIRLIKMCRLKRCCTLSTFSPGIKSSKTSAAIPFIFDKNYQVIGKRFLHSSSLLNYNWCMKKWMQYYFTITFLKKNWDYDEWTLLTTTCTNHFAKRYHQNCIFLAFPQ